MVPFAIRPFLRRHPRGLKLAAAALVTLNLVACGGGADKGGVGEDAGATETDVQGLQGEATVVPTESGMDGSASEGSEGEPATAADERMAPEGDAAEAAATPDPADPALPPSGEVDGVPVGFTQAGFPYRGAPDAPLVIEEYSDFHCPFCARFATQTKPALLEEYAAPGRVRFVFREFPIASLHPRSALVHAAAACVAEQGAEPYWRLNDALFARQTESTSAASLEDFLAEQVAELGIDDAAYADCVASGRTQAEVERGVAAAASLGYNGTPSFRFVVTDGGATFDFSGAQPTEEFEAWIDALLAGVEPPIPPTPEPPEPPELPYWADEGLAPDPVRPGVNLAGDPYEGSPDAKLTVVEFTDYQCPPCRDFTLESHPAIAAALIDTGEVRWVVKNLPLPEHPQAPVAAAAAECAVDQGAFWGMHSALFESVERWSIETPDSELARLAQQADLDMTVFTDCLSGRQAMQRVMADQFEALGITQSTPTFVILEQGSGSLLQGNQSPDDMIDILRLKLVGASGGDPTER